MYDFYVKFVGKINIISNYYHSALVDFGEHAVFFALLCAVAVVAVASLIWLTE